MSNNAPVTDYTKTHHFLKLLSPIALESWWAILEKYIWLRIRIYSSHSPTMGSQNEVTHFLTSQVEGNLSRWGLTLVRHNRGGGPLRDPPSSKPARDEEQWAVQSQPPPPDAGTHDRTTTLLPSLLFSLQWDWRGGRKRSLTNNFVSKVQCLYLKPGLYFWCQRTASHAVALTWKFNSIELWCRNTPSYALYVNVHGINGSAGLRQLLICDNMLQCVMPSKV